ncbi:Adaptive-response sensory-kinase SasA [Vibrio marisflavi CECT 7928]|uniref:Ammonium transporter n=2 Tax=Vibrio marisflavi TaxID=1216040 RepID=A0ABN8DWM6_9VIBR|nr:Adaptive-response sensory-kinase SasA [Vibrio marisflavi CECT 7928]
MVEPGVAYLVEMQNIMWVIFCAGSVFLMQAGFCFLEAGSVRSKNSINVAAKNFCDFCIASALFWVAGFAIMYGSFDNGFSHSYFVLEGINSPALLAFFIFQLVFCGTAATIMSGAISERASFSAYLCITLFISAIIYPFFGRWVWHGTIEGTSLGWLSQLGFVDFAGGSVVHSLAGWASLAAVLVIGPRVGRFTKGVPAIQGHNIPMATVGTLILWFGWFGFNAGSTFKLDNSIPLILINTLISASFGSLAILILSYVRHKKPNVLDILNGALAGLVSITAGCNAVTPSQAAIIGLAGGAIYLLGCKLLDTYQVDDVVKVVPVHGFCGAWGTLCVALFGDPVILSTGLSFLEQTWVQVLGIATCFFWTFLPTYGFLKFINRFVPLRVSLEDEIRGLNVSEHNANTEVVELLSAMELHKKKGSFHSKVHEEPHTEVGQIAREYNRVLAIASEEIDSRIKANEELEQSFKRLQDTQSQLVESEKMASLGGLVASITHEVKTPMGVSLTASTFLKEEVDDIVKRYQSGELSESGLEQFFDSAKESSDIIHININRATDLIKSFKEMSVDQASEKYRQFDLKQYIQKVLTSMQPQFRKTQYQIDFSCPDGLIVYTHPGALSQIVSSFLMNSLYHGFEGRSEGVVEINANLIDHNIVIEYSDNGVGISKQNLERIFEPFYTTKHGKGGSGLGLHIVYNIVTNTLGGTINCESEVNKFTRFSVSFPDADMP